MEPEVATGEARQTEPGIGLPGHLLAIAVALTGGTFGIAGAFIQELRTTDLFIAFVGGPIIEEFLKPTGVYILLVRWPHLLRGRLHTAFLSALGGLAFAVVENVVYLYVYFPEHSQALALYRYTVTLGMHTLASFMVGLGITPRLLASVKGEVPLLSGSRKYYAAGIILHSAYNIAVVIAEAAFGAFEDL